MKNLRLLTPSSIGIATIAIFSILPAYAEYDCEASMGEAIDCADNAVRTEKNRLNTVYMNIYKTLTASQKQQMDKDQMAWIKQRDATCTTVDPSAPMNNMLVWQSISDQLCVATETKNRADYYLNEFKANHITPTVKAAAGHGSASKFRKVKTENGGDITHYRGVTIVSGLLDISHPEDDYTPCSLCFRVNKKDSYKIPREADDSRDAWFSFNNIKYDTTKGTYQLGDLTLSSKQCYEPIKATIKIKDYIADKTPTETVDTTTLLSFISMDTPKVVACEPFVL